MVGAVFNWFRGVDLPYNLCPSLHIALRTILADLYARHTRGVSRWAAHIWFSLIGVSTLLTYQHHVIDVAGGFALAAVCFYAVRESPFRMPVEANWRIGRLYGLGSILLIAVGVALRPWGLLLLYPALSLALVAGAYFGLGPGIFGKVNGRLPLSTRIVLGPALFGQYLSLLYYRRQCRPWDVVTDRLWIGGRLTPRQSQQAIDQGVTAVLDLMVEFSEVAPFRETEYRHLPVLDLTAPSHEQLQAAAAFIEEQSRHGVVYVHCKIGYSRSAAVIGAYLLSTGRFATADEAIGVLRSIRPSIVVRPEAEAALHRWADGRPLRAAATDLVPA